MFGEYNVGLFPVVIVKLKGCIQDENDYQLFTNNWENLYDYENDFMMIFDTTELGIPNIKYCYKIASFIKNLKNKEKQYLKKSIIIVKNDIISNLLHLTFNLQSPIAPVYLTKTSLADMILKINFKELINMDIDNLMNLITIDKVIDPTTSYFNCL